MDAIKDKVQDYYGKILATTNDLKTNACCDDDAVPDWLKAPLTNIHPEVASKYYGCGLVAPEKLKGAKILDLGSGSGRDCYLLSQLVGEGGLVIGVDMTDEQLAIANQHLEYHRQKFGFKKSNVKFLKGQIEKLDELGLDDNYFDIIISNCVINLSTDKAAVFREAHRVLKNGGEMYFSDVYASKKMPQHLIDDPVLYGECLSGALYWNDFFHLARSAGFIDPRLISSRTLDIQNQEVKIKTRGIDFYSSTYRLFKIAAMEPNCEDYGQAVKYLGLLENQAEEFALDNEHIFKTAKLYEVCGNTYLMLKDSRFADDFEFYGSFDKHFGPFPGCGNHMPYNTNEEYSDSQSCC